MGYNRGAALLNLDVYREEEKERQIWEDEQNAIAQRAGNSSLWGAGLGMLGGALLGPAGMFIGQQLGKYGSRALADGNLLSGEKGSMFGMSQSAKDELAKGKFHSKKDDKYKKQLDDSDSLSSALFGSFGDALSMGIAAGGPAALSGEGGAVGGLKELTTYGVSNAGGKAGLLGGFVDNGQGGNAFMSPKAQWKAGMFADPQTGISKYSRNSKYGGITKGTKTGLGLSGTQSINYPKLNMTPTASPKFSAGKYLMGMGSNNASLATGASPPGSSNFLNNLYSGATSGMSPWQQLQQGNQIGQGLNSFITSGSND